MTTTNRLQVIACNFHKPLKTLTAGAVALALGFFAGASNVQATTYTWTNTTGSAYNDPGAWSPIGGPGTSTNSDTANFTISGTINCPITNDVTAVGNASTVTFGAGSGSGTLILSLNLGTNTMAGVSVNTTSGSGFVFGQQGTSIVFIAGGKLLCTNSTGNARMLVGRNGPGIVNLTNGFVAAGNLVIANGTGASGSKVVVSGPNSFWSNSTTIAVGNAANANGNSLVISNSGSMVALSTYSQGTQSPGNFNALLLDSSGALFTKNTASVGTGSGSSNNTVTIQGGAVWDLGAKALTLGNTGGSSNILIVGNNGILSNATTLTINSSASLVNSLVISGGLLKASSTITMNASPLRGFGTIVGSTVVTNTGTVSVGLGTTVGTLTFSNNLTFLLGSTTVIKLDKGQTGSNDLLVVAGTLSAAGTLTVNNVGAALVGGDTFKIISAAAPGGYTSINLPPLTGSLVWNTSQLNSQGIISVVLPPTIVGPDPQAVFTNSTVVISTVVTGVPAPSLQWQLGGVNTTDGPTGNGSSITGSTSGTLTILNAQIADSGHYCLIASNGGGAVTNCMTLEVTDSTAAPLIGGPTDQNVISPNSATFTAVVAGIPTPTQQWQDNGVNISGETNTTLVIPGVTFAQDGHVYCIIASNSVGTVTNCAALHVVVPPSVAVQPVSLVVTQTQSATFSILSTNGVPAPTYQWFFNNVLIPGASNASYTIASAVPANDGNYNCTVANVAGSSTSSNAILTVNSTMSAGLTPANAAPSVCYDTPLYMAFDRLPVLTGAGKVSIYSVNNTVTPVDMIDTGLGPVQSRIIGGETFSTFPIIITGNTIAIYPHLGVLSSNQTYYVTVDPGIFSETNGALYAGITGTNGWVFTTKPTGPANPFNIIVSTNESDDFATVQGAVDSVAASNTTYTLVSIRNGTYTEIVDTRLKNNITFRGQDRIKTRVGYPNNNNINGSTANRMAFKINANDNAIENMTVTNMTPKGGSQAEAIMVNTAARRFILNNAEVDSFQDTILINDFSSQAYFYKSLIVGDTDFIWGVGNLFATNCEIRSVTANASITQPRTIAGSNGLDFVDCLITRSGASVTNTTFGRALGFCDGNAAFINCRIDSNLVGWTTTDLSGCPNIRWWTYNNTDLLTGSPLSYNGVTLTNGDPNLACALDPVCWLSGWVPQLAPNILTNPVSQTVTAGVSATFSVVATGVPDPTYQWQEAGTNLIGQTGASLTISNAHCADAGTYSVIVSNIAGSVTSSNATLTVIGSAPAASFTAVPTSGTEPLAVTFTDTSVSSLSPVSILWNFGDLSSTTTTGGATVVHTYAAGTYTVTLTASNACDSSTITSNSVITALTAFQAWQLLHFGCTNCPQAAATADPDGDGQNNLAEFLAGTDPNNSASGLHITSVVPSGSDVVITWSTAGGVTNVVQATAGDGNGGYSTNFTDLSGLIVITGSGDMSTNYTDVGGGTNRPSRYYRVRLAP